jgi:signal transduction histidine kinase
MVKRSIAKGDTAAFSPVKLERMIDVTERQVSRLTRLVDDMLDVSRIETGKLELHPEAIDLSELVANVAQRLIPQIYRAGSALTTALEPAVGCWDRFRIEQVLINLLTNAARYGGGKPIEVVLRVAPDGCAAELSVADCGTGIAKADQERIFGRFERAVSSSEATGLGLGLYIAREIVEAHDGSIAVESESGAGARFIVTLPLSGGVRTEANEQ